MLLSASDMGQRRRMLCCYEKEETAASSQLRFVKLRTSSPMCRKSRYTGSPLLSISMKDPRLTTFCVMQRTLLFLDPSSDPTAPGWPLRNFLAYLAARHRIKRLRIICWRATLQESLTSIVSLESAEVYNITSLSAVGWEKNQAGKLAPRVADLGGLMDPRRCRLCPLL